MRRYITALIESVGTWSGVVAVGTGAGWTQSWRMTNCLVLLPPPQPAESPSIKVRVAIERFKTLQNTSFDFKTCLLVISTPSAPTDPGQTQVWEKQQRFHKLCFWDKIASFWDKIASFFYISWPFTKMHILWLPREIKWLKPLQDEVKSIYKIISWDQANLENCHIHKIFCNPCSCCGSVWHGFYTKGRVSVDQICPDGSWWPREVRLPD